MKRKGLLFALAIALIAGLEYALFGSSFSVIASAIPAGSFYANKADRPGMIPERHPGTNIRALATESAIPFGRLVALTSDRTKARIFDSVSLKIAGVAVAAQSAQGVDSEQYNALESADILDDGFILMHVEEAVTPASTVRVRHANEAATASYQDATFSAAKAGGDATGLANDATVYTATVKINGIENAVAITGSAAQTFTNLITQINADLNGATASITGDGNIRITADVDGSTGSIAITDVDLFSTLTDFDALGTAVQGSDDPDLDKVVGGLCTSAEAGKTAVLSGFEFRGSTTGPGVVAVRVMKSAFAVTADT